MPKIRCWSKSNPQKIDFPGNLDRGSIKQMFFIIEKAKETVLDFSKGAVKVL